MRAIAPITAAGLVLLVLWPVLADAGEPEPPSVIPQKARVLADRGRAFHDAGDYASAIVAFKEAYVMAPSPGLLFNLAQAYRLQGNCDDASLMYRRFLGTHPSAEGRVIAEGHLAAVERCLRKRGLHLPLDASAGVVTIPPVPGTLHAEAPGARRARLQKDIGVGITLGGAVAMSVALYYAFDASSSASAIEDAYARGAKWSQVETIHERGERAERYARVFGIGGALAVAGGVTLYVLGKRAERLAPIAIAPTTRGAEVSVAWRF